MSAILNHDDYTILWIAILDIEVQAALAAMNSLHRGSFLVEKQDDYTYIAGEVESHYVVIAKLPEGSQYGTVTAASLVNHAKQKFKNIWFALLVGVAAGLPDYDTSSPNARDIRLGDVLVCVPGKHNPGVVQYDIGHDTNEGFLPNSRQPEPPANVRSAISSIKHTLPSPFMQGNELAQMLNQLQERSDITNPEKNKFDYPGQDKDELFVPNWSNNNGLQEKRLTRRRRNSAEVTRVWYGSIGSANTLMRNAKRRDELRREFDLIGLEMEAAGVMPTMPAGMIRGVCDYADEHKTKIWQPYAAAVAAVYARALLRQIRIGPRLESKIVDSVSRNLNLLRSRPELLKISSHRYHHFMTQDGMLLYAELWEIIHQNRSDISYTDMIYSIAPDLVPPDIIRKFWLRFAYMHQRLGRPFIMAIFFMIHLEHLSSEQCRNPSAAQYKTDNDLNENFRVMDKWEACPDDCGREWNFAASEFGFCQPIRSKAVVSNSQCLVYRRHLEKKEAGITSRPGFRFKSRLTQEEKEQAESMRSHCKSKWLGHG